MYNLLVHARDNYWNEKPAELGIERFTEFTTPDLKKLFKDLSPETIKKLISIPCLFAYEDSNKKDARLGWIEEIRIEGSKLHFKYRLESGANPIPYLALKDLIWDLDIDSLEMTRTHWAIKDIDLIKVLIETQFLQEGLILSKPEVPVFANTLPEPKNRSVLDSLPLSELTKLPTAFTEYKALRLVGEGRGGRVYEVSDNQETKFALKILSPERVNSENISRLKNELFFFRKNSHPNIVDVLDTGYLMVNKIKCPFYVMPLYPCNFRSIIEQEKDIKIKLRYFLMFLEGLVFAHSKNCWHRDIKPENILCDRRENKVVLADFGIAHIHEEFMPNFLYASPEQRTRGDRVDHRSDIYSVGLILNEIFTGTIPWGADHKNIAGVASDFADLDPYVNSMLQHEANKRFDDLPKLIEVIRTKLRP